jgi:hypothetical protein
MPISNYLPSSRLIQPGVCTSTTRPASPFEGMVIYETDTNKTYVYNGSSWVMQISADTPPGLQLIKAQAVGSTPVASVTLTDVFSSEFDAYKLIWAGGNLDMSGDITVQLGPSSVSGYNSSYLTTVTYWNGSVGGWAQTNASEFAWTGGGTSTQSYMECELYGPNVARYTRMHLGAYANGTTNIGFSTGEHRQNGQYTSVTVGGGGGSKLSNGTISVYGFRK